MPLDGIKGRMSNVVPAIKSDPLTDLVFIPCTCICPIKSCLLVVFPFLLRRVAVSDLSI